MPPEPHDHPTQDHSTRAAPFRDRQGLTDLLHRELPALTGAQRVLALHVLAHLERVPFLSATDLAAAAGVSQSSVTRFAARLGFTRYPHFTTGVGEALLHDAPAHAPADRFEHAPPGSPHAAVLRGETLALQALGPLLDHPDFRRAASVLAAADHVVVAGFAAAAALAVHASLYLSRLRPGTDLHTAVDAALMTQAPHWTPRHAALLIAAPRPATDTVRFLGLLRAQGVPVVLVGDPASVAVLGAADVTLVVPVTLGPTTAVPAAMLTLVSLLVDAVALEQPERSRHALRRFEHLSAAGNLFVQGAPRTGPHEQPEEAGP